MTNRIFDVHEPSQVSSARREAVALASALGYGEARSGQVALVASELATNLAKHAREGQMLVRPLFGSSRPHGAHPYAGGIHPTRVPATTAVDAVSGIELIAIDRGPGIRDAAAARRDGYSTTGSLGSGLGAVERQSDQFDLFSQPVGTVMVARVWKHPPAARGTDAREVGVQGALAVSAVSVPVRGESWCGDAWAAHLETSLPTILVVDGLGHGLGAAEAARIAVEAFDRASAADDRSRGGASSPLDVVNQLHLALRPTRGAAIAAVQFDPLHASVRFAGLGNISGTIVFPDLKRQAMVSHNGTAGHVAQRVQEFTYPLVPHATVVLHSDGLGSQWNPPDYVGLWSRDPALIAGVLFRDFGRGRDDTTVVAARWTPS